MKYLLIAVIALSMLNCQDEENHFHIMEFRSCNSILTDSLAIATRLVGEWRWTERYCPCCADVKPEKADKKVVVTFNQDGTYSVSENGVIVSSGDYELNPAWGEFFSIHTSAVVPMNYLSGTAEICQNLMLTDMTPVDGCRHLFVKVK